jgi:acyl-CoA thioester hydrolase
MFVRLFRRHHHLSTLLPLRKLSILPDRALSVLPASFQIHTRVQDTDLMGHINNVNYYAFMDTAICNWSISRGDDLPNTPRFIAETGLKYHAPAQYPETIEVSFGVDHLGCSSVKYKVAMISCDDQRLLVSGHFVHVYVDKNGRPTPMTKKTREMLESIVVVAD